MSSKSNFIMSYINVKYHIKYFSLFKKNNYFFKMEQFSEKNQTKLFFCIFIHCRLQFILRHMAQLIYRFPISQAQMPLLHFDFHLSVITIITGVWIQSGPERIHRCMGHHTLVSVSIFTRMFEESRQSASVTVTQKAHETPRFLKLVDESRQILHVS